MSFSKVSIDDLGNTRLNLWKKHLICFHNTNVTKSNIFCVGQHLKKKRKKLTILVSSTSLRYIRKAQKMFGDKYGGRELTYDLFFSFYFLFIFFCYFCFIFSFFSFVHFVFVFILLSFFIFVYFHFLISSFNFFLISFRFWK